VSVSWSTTICGLTVPVPALWIDALTRSTYSGIGSVMVVGVHGSWFGSEQEMVTTQVTVCPGWYGPVLVSDFPMAQEAADADVAGTATSGRASANAPSTDQPRRNRPPVLATPCDLACRAEAPADV
jgi:hypothetical protein